MRLRHVVLTAGLAGLGVLVSACAAAEAPPVLAASSPATPIALPAVTVKNLDDQPVRLEAVAAGKPALVSFWATWCDACVAEMDALNRLNDSAAREGAVVIGVAVGETREKAAAFAHERGLRYAQLVDPELALADALGQKRLPATVVLNRSGRAVFSGGALDERAIEALRAASAAR